MALRSNRVRFWLRAGALLACMCLLFAGGAALAQGKKAKESGQPRQSGLSKRVAEALTEANVLLEADKFDEALVVIDEVSKRRGLSPTEIAQIHRFRGYILLSKGDMDKVAVEFEKSLEQQALDTVAERQMTYSLAQIYTQLGKYDQALELINAWFETGSAEPVVGDDGEIIEPEKPKPDAYHLKAMILVQQEKFKEALEPARTAVEMEPNPRESWVQLLVAIYSQLSDFPNVAVYLERLISMSPQKKQYWTQLAAVQNLLEREARALATLQLAHRGKLLSEDREFRQLARLLFLRELPYECAKLVQESVNAGSMKGDAETYRLMSNCFLAAREHELAFEPLAKAGELAPDGEMYMLLGQLHLQRERFDPALEALQKALAKSKPEQRGQVQLLIGVAQMGTERFEDAERSFRAASSDKKVSEAAQSYLKFLEDQRLRKQLQEQQELMLQQASAEG